MIKSKAITIERIKPLIGEMVEQKLIELLGDPDFGLALKPNIKMRLSHSLSNKIKGISAKKVAEELGLKW